MIIKPIKTKKLIPPHDDLFSAIRSVIKKIPERSILAVTSKVVSINEGRCVLKEKVPDKDKLIMAEAEYYLPRDPKAPWVMHTLLHNLLIPTAGIDESNANGFYILWPQDPKQSAREIYNWMRATYKTKECGVVITDSRSGLLRRGVIGISLSSWGFAPLNDYRGQHDLFGREFEVSQANVPDGLASAAVVAMGEGAEQTPLALITDIPFVRFQLTPYQSKKEFSSFEVALKEDLYAPFFSRVKWRKGGGGKKNKKRVQT